MKRVLLIFSLLYLQLADMPVASGQGADLSQVWPAQWIGHPEGPHKEYAVFHFRKTFDLKEVPDTLMVHTSGDNRYQLYVNDHLVTWGPLRGDLRHWYYESTDIAPYLRKGKNVLAATVMNYGSHPPDAQFTVQTAFLLCAGRKEYRHLNTDSRWKVIHNAAYSPNIVDNAMVRGYYGGGSREIVDGNRYTWNWQSVELDDSQWQDAWQIESAKAKTCIWAGRWKLTPRTLPLEERVPEDPLLIRKIEGLPTAGKWLDDYTIPENSRVSIILDRGYETTAFPTLKISGGIGAQIRLIYVEAPHYGNPGSRKKGNRNEIEDKNFTGYFDQYVANGLPEQVYTPLWWRAFRYIKLDVVTQSEALVLNELQSVYSAYPFETEAEFEWVGTQNKVDLEKLLEIGERTLRLCAHETYTDCPYYEESQFEGDTRVQALAGYYTFGDPKLAKNAIEQFAWSINDEGFLSARYPANSLYYIPNYSLFWIGMIYDYMMHVGDLEFVKTQIPVMHSVIGYFERRSREDNTIGRPDYHNFVDWSFPQGEGPFDENGYSALVDLHVLMAYRWAATVEEKCGDEVRASIYRNRADLLARSIRDLYWDETLGLYKDVPGEEKLSVHTNCLAIITGISSGDEAREIMLKTLSMEAMVRPTIYWHFYMFEALNIAGLGDEYMFHLDLWKQMMEAGCTTWPETGLESRSECHGWGASPNYHVYKIIAGIESAAPGFKEVRIAPYLGPLEKINVTMPHPDGAVTVKAHRTGQHGLEAVVELPAGTKGVFQWKRKEIVLSTGLNRIKL